MTALIRFSLFAIAGVFAIFIAIVLVKLFVALAAVAIVVLAAVFLYHFARAFYRRMTARREPAMLGSGPTTTTY